MPKFDETNISSETLSNLVKLLNKVYDAGIAETDPTAKAFIAKFNQLIN